MSVVGLLWIAVRKSAFGKRDVKRSFGKTIRLSIRARRSKNGDSQVVVSDDLVVRDLVEADWMYRNCRDDFLELG